jgi:hypothetical protein
VLGDLIETPWYVRLVGDASQAYEPEDVNSFVREVVYLRKAGEGDPPDTFVIFDDVDATAPSRMDWHLHTYGKMAVDGNRVTIVQDDAAADVTVVAPEDFAHEVLEKSLEEAGGPKPFEGAEGVTFLKLRPVEPVERGYFLSVIMPRLASESPSGTVTGVRGVNTLGARVVNGAVEDLVLFALDEPEMAADGIAAVGRSCTVRRSDGRITAAALQNGQRLSVEDTVLFQTDGCGHVVMTIGEDAVEAKLDLYDGTEMRLHAAEQPTRVLVNGKEEAFEYEAESRCVRLGRRRVQEVQILFG